MVPDNSLSSGASDANPRVASVGTEYVVTWGDGNDIQLLRVGADGLPKGTAKLVNTGARQAGTQDTPAIASFSTGEFAIVWHDAAGDAGDIRVQKFDNKGAPTGNEVEATVNDVKHAGSQIQPAIAAGSAKGAQRYYLIAWSDVADQQIAARFLNVDSVGYGQSTVDPGGSSSEFAVALAAGPKSSPAVAIGPSTPGYCAVLWSDDSPGSAGANDDRVRVRRLPGPYYPH